MPRSDFFGVKDGGKIKDALSTLNSVITFQYVTISVLFFFFETAYPRLFVICHPQVCRPFYSYSTRFASTANLNSTQWTRLRGEKQLYVQSRFENIYQKKKKKSQIINNESRLTANVYRNATLTGFRLTRKMIRREKYFTFGSRGFEKDREL